MNEYTHEQADQDLKRVVSLYISAMDGFTVYPTRSTLKTLKESERNLHTILRMYECNRPYIGHYTTNRNGVMVFHARSD